MKPNPLKFARRWAPSRIQIFQKGVPSMRCLLLVSSIAATLVGCAPPPGGYRPPYENLRQVSLSVVATLAASVKTDLVNETPQQVIEKGKKAIADTLKDPVSAQFRNVRLVQYLDGAVICGEINGKNSYGGYVGFRDFVAGSNSGTMRSIDEAKYADITAASNTGIDTACSGQPYVPVLDPSSPPKSKG